jgi:hypothetical protein
MGNPSHHCVAYTVLSKSRTEARKLHAWQDFLSSQSEWGSHCNGFLSGIWMRRRRHRPWGESLAICTLFLCLTNFQTLLPAAVAIIQGFPGSPDTTRGKASIGAMVGLTLATIISSHSALIQFNPSFVHLILGLCTTTFLFVGFTKAQTLGSCTSDKDAPAQAQLVKGTDENGDAKLDLLSHGLRTAFLIQLRAIALLLVVMLTTTLYSRYHLEMLSKLGQHWWNRELAVAGIDALRWASISLAVFHIIASS